MARGKLALLAAATLTGLGGTALVALLRVARAQAPFDWGLLPQTGSGAGLAVPPRVDAHTTAPAWQVSPAISVQQEWTDNALNAGDTLNAVRVNPARASFITVVTPSLSVAGETARLGFGLTYAPSVAYYSSVSGQNQVAQNLDASGHVTLLADQLFIDLRGFANSQSRDGATAPPGTVALSRQNQVQNSSFSVSPYLQHRFGGWGSAQLGVADLQTTQTALAGTLPGSTSASQSLNTRQEYATFTSGENFGRLLGSVLLSARQNTGSGVLQGAYRNIARYQAGYAITHSVTALASVGWEDIGYASPLGSQGAGLHIADATWSVGTKLTPNPDSSITLDYGHQDGATAVSLDAAYAPGARTLLFARYSVGVSTAAEELQSTLATARFDPLGHPVDAQTGAPLQLTNNFYGANGTVYQVRSLSLTAAWSLDRDAVQATVNRQERTPQGGQTAAGNFPTGNFATGPDTGTYGSLAWQHDLSPVLRSTLFGQYGIDRQSGAGTRLDSRLLALSAGLSWQIAETLTGTLQYSYTSNSYQRLLPATAANLVAVGVRKMF